MAERISGQHGPAGLVALLRMTVATSVRPGTSVLMASTHHAGIGGSRSATFTKTSDPSTISLQRARCFSSTSHLSVSAHRKQAGREKARLRSMRQEERLLRRREKDGFSSASVQKQNQLRPRDPIDEAVESNIREYMARTGPRGERLTRAQQERLLKHELKGLGHQLEKLEKKAKADQATQDLPELDDHMLEELYQALMLPPPPTAEEARLARLEGGRRERGLQRCAEQDGRGRRMLGIMEGPMALLSPTKADERRMRAGMDLKQKMIDAREKGKMLLPPSSSPVRRTQEFPTAELPETKRASVQEEQIDMVALPYAERQEIRLQQLFARLSLVHSTSDASTAESESGTDSLQDIKSNLAHRIAKILQEHDYKLQSASPDSAEKNTAEAEEEDPASPPPPFAPVRLDGRASALSAAKNDQMPPETKGNSAANSRDDVVAHAETMINDLSSTESRQFLLDSIEKLVLSASASTTDSTTVAPLPLGIATTEEWTALAVSSAQANDTATLSRTMSLMQAAGYHPAPLELYNNVMDAFATNGQVELCQEWLQQMSEVGLVPDDHTYHSLTKAYVNTSQFVPAIQLINSLEASGRPASMATYTLIIDRLLDPVVAPATGVKDERPELQALAWNVFYHMRLHAHPVPDVPLYTLMIRACARGIPQPHDIDDALGSSTISASRARPSSRISDAERALDLFREMTTRYSVRPNAEVYNALILACARRKDFYLEAFRLLREMVELETERSHINAGHGGMLRFAPDRYTFNALLQGCARNRDLARARWVLAEMIRSTLPLFDAEVSQGLTRAQSVELLSKRPNEETMCHVLHTYAAYVPPVKRTQLASQAQSREEPPSGAATPLRSSTLSNTDKTDDIVTDAHHAIVASEVHQDENTTAEEAAHIFSALVPQTSSDLVSESRSLFARILADQPTSDIQGPLGAVTPGVRLVNAYLTVLAAHLPRHQRPSVLHSTLLNVEQSDSQEHASLECALFAKLRLEPNEHSYRIVLQSLSEAGAESARLVNEVWDKFQEFMGKHTTATEGGLTAVARGGESAQGAEPIDAVEVTKCWSAYIHYHAKTSTASNDKIGLDRAMALVREYVCLYPPQLSPDMAARSGRRKALKKARIRQMASLREHSSKTRLDLTPLPVPWKSLQTLIALSDRSDPLGFKDNTSSVNTASDCLRTQPPATLPLSFPPSFSFLDVQLLHHRLVRYGRTKDLAYLSWVLHRYAAARRSRGS